MEQLQLKEVYPPPVVKPLKFIVIGNPENRRIGLFHQALNYWNLSSAKVLDYLDLIGQLENLANIIVSQTTIRIESPERNFLVEKAIIAAGANIEPEENHQQITAALMEKMLILVIGSVTQWFGRFLVLNLY